MRRTKTINQDLNPIWNQKFSFQEISGGEYLKLKCYDADRFGDENLGSARVNLQGLEDGSKKDVWVPLEKIKQGEVRLRIEVAAPDYELDGSQVIHSFITFIHSLGLFPLSLLCTFRATDDL